MTAASLNCLRKRIESQEWLKGAVNYDEDLHFSSYYLRASCAPATRSLYPGYSCVVAFYEDFNETYFLLKDECQATAAAIIDRALRQPRWLPGVLDEIRRRSDALADIFPADLSASRLARLSDAALFALYRRHDLRHRALYKFARLPEALDRGVGHFTAYLKEHLRRLGLSAAASEEAFDTLSRPVVPSVLMQEALELEAIAHEMPSPLDAKRLADGAARARLWLAPELLRRLEAHRQKWQYLPYHGYGRRELATLEHYIDRLADQTATKPATSCLLERCAQAERERRQLLDRLAIDPAHRALFEAYPEIGAVKLHRRYAQLRNFYYLDLLLAEIARRLDVSEWTVRCMLPEEVGNAVRGLSAVGARIRERMAGCAYVIVGESERILTGAQAAELRRLFPERKAKGTAGNVLRGVVACRGRAVGRCRVVIRADDCRGDFPHGTILVSESTDPDLVPFLRVAGAVLTEQGGVTAHAAVICRELGVPTIIGVEGLLQRVRDGDWVKVDAEAGNVTLLGKDCRQEAAPPAPEHIGSKAYNLGVVQSLGFRVPEYALLGHDEVRRVARGPASRRSQQVVRRVLRELGLTNGDRLALRSSAITEDRDDGSAAGEYHSLLDVGRDRLAAGLRDFARRNQFGRNGTAYRGSVIVQRMIHADCAGVCLTRDARAGRGDAVILEMTPGGNGGVTGGTIRPDRVVVDRLTGDILEEERHCGALRRGGIDLAALVRQLLALEARFGKPLDVEWALADRELYILQARPIVHGRSEAAAASSSQAESHGWKNVP